MDTSWEFDKGGGPKNRNNPAVKNIERRIDMHEFFTDHTVLLQQSEPDDRFYVAPSTIPGAGNGVFARALLPEGTELNAVGLLIRRDSQADECTKFADPYKLRVGEDFLLIPAGLAGLVNHSQKPNLEKVVDGTSVVLRALRPIEPGEELFFSYSEYAQRRFGIF